MASVVAMVQEYDTADRPAPFLLDIALLHDNVPLLERVVQRWGPQALEDPGMDALGRPPLMVATFHGATKAMEYILAQWAAAGQGKDACSSSSSASPSRPPVDANALVNARHADGGLTALFLAVWASHAPLVHLLLDRGADVSLRYGLPDGSAEGVTIVMVAALRAHRRGAAAGRNGEETLRVIIEHSCVHARGRLLLQAKDGTRGRSALHYAAEQGNDQALWLLLSEGGCDPMATDHEGQMALDICDDLGFLGCAHLLRVAMGEVERSRLLRRARALGDCAAQSRASMRQHHKTPQASLSPTAAVPACIKARMASIPSSSAGGGLTTTAMLPRLDIRDRPARGQQRRGGEVCGAVLRYAVGADVVDGRATTEGAKGADAAAALPPDLFEELMGMMGPQWDAQSPPR